MTSPPCMTHLVSTHSIDSRPQTSPLSSVSKRLPVVSPLCQVSPQEMVQEIHQVLMDREDTCHRTCFSLQLDGNVLDNFAELKSIEGLQEASQLKVVEGERTLGSALKLQMTAAQ